MGQSSANANIQMTEQEKIKERLELLAKVREESNERWRRAEQRHHNALSPMERFLMLVGILALLVLLCGLAIELRHFFGY